MAKQILTLGSAVDDGQGDYLRLGGQKINSNFNDVYSELGDDTNLFPAGQWKLIRSADKGTIEAKFGQSYAIDSSGGPLAINLPKGTPADYGKVIKIRDVIGSFTSRPVTIIAAQTNTIKGVKSKRLTRRWQDIELTFVQPGRWEYLENKLIDRLQSTDAPTIIKKEIIAQDNQKDFINPFGDTVAYNTQNLLVYYRGNLLTYGTTLTDDSDYGSVDKTNADNILPLDGKTIRLRNACSAGDTVTLITFLDDPQVFQSSYVQKTLQVIDNRIMQAVQLGGNTNGILHINPFEKRIFTRDDLGITDADGQINPFSLEVLVNGIQLTRSDQINTSITGKPSFCCEKNGINDYDVPDSFTCEQQGGVWNDSGIDFCAVQNSAGDYTSIKFAEPLVHGDIITIRWFNNTLGTLLSEQMIDDLISAGYLSSDYNFFRRNRIQYADITRPSELTKQALLDDTSEVRCAQVTDFFDQIYPIGQIYINANNTANPRDYMGFGTWVRFGEGRTIVSWNASDSNDADFGINNNANNVHAPGGTGGTRSNKLLPSQIPALNTDNLVLEKATNGDVIVGQCQEDPDTNGPGYKKYNEVRANVGAQKGENNTVNNLMPYIVVSMWIRVQ